MSRRPNDPRSPTPENIERAQQAERILEYRAAGMTIAQISERVGLSPNAVNNRIKRAIANLPKHNAQELVAVETERLDKLQAIAWGIADADAPEFNEDQSPDTQRRLAEAYAANRLRAVETVLKVMERRAKLLGLDHAEMRALEDAQRQLSADQGALVAGALERIMNALGLTPEQREQFPAVAARELRRIAAEPPADVVQGEIEETEDDQ